MARRSGCSLPILLVIFVAVALTFDRGSGNVEMRRPQVERVPVGSGSEEIIELPGVEPEYGIAEPGPPRDSQGTGFAISPDGLWLTAEHVVNGCDMVGLAISPGQADRVRQVFESEVSDAAAIADGLPSEIALPLAAEVPQPGADGWHIGFPTGEPAVVHSRFIGMANAVRGRFGPSQPILAWAELERIPEFDHTLGGISGGPTLDRLGRVVGINSASSERRGRILTTHPAQARNLLRAAGLAAPGGTSAPIANTGQAVERFAALYRAGAIRQVYCDVSE